MYSGHNGDIQVFLRLLNLKGGILFMMTNQRLQEAKFKRNNLKHRLIFSANMYMIKYYNRYISQLDKLILKNLF